MNPIKPLLLFLTLSFSFASSAQLRDHLDFRVGMIYDIPVYFDTWEWYGDDVSAPFPTTFGGITIGMGSTINRFIYWSADLQASMGEGRFDKWTYSYSLPLSIGFVTPNERFVNWKVGAFAGPQKFVSCDPLFSFHMVAYYGITSGLVIAVGPKAISLDAFYAPAYKVDQMRRGGVSTNPPVYFEHLRFTMTYQW